MDKITGKKLALLKNASKMAGAIIDIKNNNEILPIEKALAEFKTITEYKNRHKNILFTPRDRFNDDGTLKPYENALTVDNPKHMSESRVLTCISETNI